MEDLKQTPPASIESDAPSEYMRGYSDGREKPVELLHALVHSLVPEDLLHDDQRLAYAEACAFLGYKDEDGDENAR